MRIVGLLLFLVFGCYSTERDCLQFQTGNFEFTSIVGNDTISSTFTRTKTLEIDRFQGKIDSASVRWVSDCECIVQKLNPTSIAEKKAIQMNRKGGK